MCIGFRFSEKFSPFTFIQDMTHPIPQVRSSFATDSAQEAKPVEYSECLSAVRISTTAQEDLLITVIRIQQTLESLCGDRKLANVCFRDAEFGLNKSVSLYARRELARFDTHINFDLCKMRLQYLLHALGRERYTMRYAVLMYIFGIHILVTGMRKKVDDHKVTVRFESVSYYSRDLRRVIKVVTFERIHFNFGLQ